MRSWRLTALLHAVLLGGARFTTAGASRWASLWGTSSRGRALMTPARPLAQQRLARDGPTMQNQRGMATFDISKTQLGSGSFTATRAETNFSVSAIAQELESIQQGRSRNVVILGTRHCPYLHLQLVELLSYALVLADNHIWTSGSTGTHAAAIRGALRAEKPELLTVILPQTLKRQPLEIRKLLGQVQQVIELGNDQLPLDAAARICNSELLSKGDQLIIFAFHDSTTLQQTIEEAKGMSILTTVFYLD